MDSTKTYEGFIESLPGPLGHVQVHCRRENLEPRREQTKDTILS